MTLPDPYRGYAQPTWDTKTLKALIDALGGVGAPAPGGGGALVRGWARTSAGYITSSTTGEARLMWTYGGVTAGNLYECALMNITPDMGNTKATEFHMRYNTSGAPSTSDAIMANSLRLSQFELGAMRAYYLAPSTGTLYIGAFIQSLDGAAVRAWCPGDGAVLSIVNLGAGPGQTGGVP